MRTEVQFLETTESLLLVDLNIGFLDNKGKSGVAGYRP
jgi:hypothetical protein